MLETRTASSRISMAKGGLSATRASARRGAWDGTKAIWKKPRRDVQRGSKTSGLRGRGGAVFRRAQMVLMPKQRRPPHTSWSIADERSPAPARTARSWRHDPNLLVEGCLIRRLPMGEHTLQSMCAASSCATREALLPAGVDQALRPS